MQSISPCIAQLTCAEPSQTALSAPHISLSLASEAAPTYDEYAVLRAERAQECEELDMEKWREAVKAVHDMVGGASTTR